MEAVSELLGSPVGTGGTGGTGAGGGGGFGTFFLYIHCQADLQPPLQSSIQWLHNPLSYQGSLPCVQIL